MSIILLSIIIGVLVEGRTGSSWKGYEAGALVLGMYIIWTYLMAEREDRMANEAESEDE